MDLLLSARLWRTPDHSDSTVAAVCRNLSARGCRLSVEDARLLAGVDLESQIWFSIPLDPKTEEVGGAAKVAWIRKERGEEGKVRLILGVEFVGIPLPVRERIKAYIVEQLGT